MKKTIVFLLLIVATSLSASSKSADPTKALMSGNDRFATYASAHPNMDAARRKELTKGQSPSAVIVSCSDSRVPPELVFDQGLGDLFVVRSAGHAVDAMALGSIEYAVEHLHTPLIVVLGHSQCGAVKAAIAGGDVPKYISSVVEFIAPAVEVAREEKGDLLENSITENVRHTIKFIIATSPIIASAITHHHVQMVGGVYDLTSNRVSLLP